MLLPAQLSLNGKKSPSLLLIKEIKMSKFIDRLEQLDNYLDKKRVENYKELLEEILTMSHIPEAMRQKVVYEVLSKHGYI